MLNYLFYILFIMQILLISYYYPRQLLGRINLILKHNPPQTHPKLYPLKPGKVEQEQHTFELLNKTILAAGCAVLFALAVGEFKQSWQPSDLDSLPLIFGLVQFIPYLLLEISQAKQFKLMRALDTRHQREAELTPRRLFDFISPFKLALVVILFFSCLAVIMSSQEFQFTQEGMVLIGALLLSNIVMFSASARLLYGKKIDPHQALPDRLNLIKGNIQSTALVSILISSFFILNRSIEVFNLDHWEFILNSLYWQCLAVLGVGTLLRNTKIKNINFDVYRNKNGIDQTQVR